MAILHARTWSSPHLAETAATALVARTATPQRSATLAARRGKRLALPFLSPTAIAENFDVYRAAADPLRSCGAPTTRPSGRIVIINDGRRTRPALTSKTRFSSFGSIEALPAMVIQ